IRSPLTRRRPSDSRTTLPWSRSSAIWRNSSRSILRCRTSATFHGGAQTNVRMTSDAPLISCIVPAFNAGRFLRETVTSITNQSYAPIEVIVADGGSDDDSLDIARSHGDGVRIVAERGLAPAATRNLGARAARGEFLAFLDADDLWHRDKLERQMQCF